MDVRAHLSMFFAKKESKRKFFSKRLKQYVKRFFLDFLKKMCACASACARGYARVHAGAKTGVRVRALQTTKMCAMCVRVCTKIRAH